jgi:hypothetical protein
MCTTHPYEISYAHNSTFTEKNYAQNLSLEGKYTHKLFFN